MSLIYKICPASAWRDAERQGVYRGSADDARDGFIHFSTATQLEGTARKHYFGQKGLFLVEVETDALGDALRWERSRNDEYSRISMANSTSARSGACSTYMPAPTAPTTFRS